MKQYLTSEQTAKLIELGFEKPKSVLLYAQSVDCDNNYGWRGEAKYNCDYTIGELIEMLPEYASQRLRYVATKRAWIFDVDILGKQGRCHRGAYYKELIDALYDMVVKLKEEGVI